MSCSFSAAVIAGTMLFALPISAEKHPARDSNNLLDPVPRYYRHSAHFSNRAAMVAKPDLNSCLKACDAGTNAIENFCRSLPPIPEMREACWSITLASIPMCKGFCYAWFLVD
jgi:hypothetical protein